MPESTGTIRMVRGQIAKVRFAKDQPGIHDILVVADNPSVKLEVVSSSGRNEFFCFILNPDHRLSRRTEVKNTGNRLMVPVGDKVLGRAFDIFSNPHDDGGDIATDTQRPLFRDTNGTLLDIETPTDLTETGIKALDFFSPILRGGKTILVGGAGVGKTVLLTSLVNRLVVEKRKQGGTERAVFSAVGERSREAQELYQDLKNAGVLPYTCLILGQMGENPAIRFHTAYAGATVAEYFRSEMEVEVLFFMDNLYRFAQAGHELATIMGEIPSEDGYQPTLASEMAHLNERLVSTSKASISSFLAVFVPSDDLTDYGVQAAFPYTNSVVILSRDVYQAGRLPAIDLLRSTSSALNPMMIGDEHYQTYIEAKQVLEKAADLERIVSLVGEEELSQENRELYHRYQLIINFMTQDIFIAPGREDKQEFIPRLHVVGALRDILDGKLDDIRPEYLQSIGTIEEGIEKSRGEARRQQEQHPETQQAGA